MKRNELPSREAIVEYYIDGLHTVQECADYFHIGKTKFYRCLKLYNIVRSEADKSAVYSRAQSAQEVRDKVVQTNLQKYGAVNKPQANRALHFSFDDSFEVNGHQYTRDWFVEEYCVKNTPIQQICQILGVSATVLYQICEHYDVRKNNLQRLDNIQKTTRKRYGVQSTLELPEVQDKSKKSLLRKYGVDNPAKSPIIQAQMKQTCIEKYGVANFSQTTEYREKILRTNLAKYGSPNHMQKNIAHLDIWIDKQKMQTYLESQPSSMTVYDLMLYFNLADRTVVYDKIRDWQLEQYVILKPARSHYENEIAEWLRQDCQIENITLNRRDLLQGREIDIYLPDYRLGIEFNGDYWHSDVYYTDHGGRSTYHQDKSLAAEKQGIFLFHIFEHEWNDAQIRDNIKNRLRSLLCQNTRKIAARKCVVVELTAEQKKDFLQQNHIQGNDHSTKNIGLVYQDELVACMTFVKPKNNKYTWELSRFCSKHHCNVQGGASKLFSHFTQSLKASDTISSYNDITKTKGDIYNILGFSCVSVNKPNYVWINFQTGDIRTRYQEQKSGEVLRMRENGYHRVCDCGTKTWVYTKS